MMPRAKIYKSNTEEYHQAFQVFLAHTDQKIKARQWLEACVQKFPSKKVFIDAGAEFMLNLLSLENSPARLDLEKYVQNRFASQAGGFRFSCNQDFLKISLK